MKAPPRPAKRPTGGNAVRAAPDETLQLPSERAWERWLEEHHAQSRGVWLHLAKKGSAGVTYAQALESALCWGWIDGQKRAHDERTFLQRFTPRSARSGWSRINREKASALIASGRMQPPGVAEVERAKQDGRWDAAYDSMRAATVPDDLAAALAASPRAGAFFPTLSSANRYAILYRIQTARRPETRARRIAELVSMLARHETLHPQKARGPAEAKKRSAGTPVDPEPGARGKRSR